MDFRTDTVRITNLDEVNAQWQDSIAKNETLQHVVNCAKRAAKLDNTGKTVRVAPGYYMMSVNGTVIEIIKSEGQSFWYALGYERGDEYGFAATKGDLISAIME